MRSEQVYRALVNIPNRFSLCQTTARATRRLHVLSTRTEDTTNMALDGISSGKFVDVVPLPEVLPAK